MANKASSNGQQSIEQLQQRYAKLNEQKIQAETNLEHAKKQLDQLQKEAREKYGTDDLAELRKKLDEMKAENEARAGRLSAGAGADRSRPGRRRAAVRAPRKRRRSLSD